MHASATISPQKNSQRDYSTWLKDYSIGYRQDGPYLYAGNPEDQGTWLLFISLTVNDLFSFKHVLFSRLVQSGVPFRLPKDVNCHHQVNTGELGKAEIGKVICIYCTTKPQADGLARELAVSTQDAKGIRIPNACYIGGTVYSGESIRPAKARRYLGKGYIPVKLIKTGPKGHIFQAVNVHRFSFTWCLVKQGKAYAADDEQGRDIRDRLRWQKEVLTNVAPYLPVPKVLDYFELKHDSYLVMEFIEGLDLEDHVKQLLAGRVWKNLPVSTRKELLGLYLQVLDIVAELHTLGYVHRDITDANFICTKAGKLYLLDFELAYSLVQQAPNPPFVLGTAGYVSPEQFRAAIPTVKEDSYSLGALLILLMTGEKPSAFLKGKPKTSASRLLEITGSKELLALVRRCLHSQAEQRPYPAQLKTTIQQYLNGMGQERPSITFHPNTETA